MPSSIIKYIYSNATEEVVRRGKKIYNLQRVSFIKQDELSHTATFKVNDDIYTTQYTVHIYKFNDPRTINLRCSCTYNVGRICRHKAAALFYLQTMLNQNMIQHKKQTYNQNLTNINLSPFNGKTIQLQCSNQTHNQAQQYLRLHKANIITAEKEKITALINIDTIEFKTTIQKTENNPFTTSCSCNSEQNYPLCVHKTILLLQLLHTHGSAYFNNINDWKEQKNQLLSSYGYNLDDNLEGKFEFTYDNGKPFLKVLDPTLKKKPSIIRNTSIIAENIVDIKQEKQIQHNNITLGIVINLNHIEYPYFRIDAVQGEADETNTTFINKVQHIDFGKPVNTNILKEQDKILIQQLRKLQSNEIHKFIDRKSTFTGFWQNVKQNAKNDLHGETEILILEYLHPKIKQLFIEINNNPFVFYLPKHQPFTTENLKKIHISEHFVQPTFKIQPQQNGFNITSNIKIKNDEIQLTQNEIESSFLLNYNNTFYTWTNTKDIETINQLIPTGETFVNINDWPIFLQEKILPLTQQYSIDLGELTQKHINNIEPKAYIQLNENGEYILLQPTFTYNNYTAETNTTKNIVAVENNTIQIIERNLNIERAFVNHIQTLHEEFIRTEDSFTLLLKGKELLKNNWLFTFIQAMQEAQIPVLGWETLKKFRFNPNKALTQLQISSNMDWFDVDIKISFGKQQANITQIQKALTKQQPYVQLEDGSLGILDEEWIKKYGILFKIGEKNNNQLKITNHHFNIIDDLFEAKDHTETYIQFKKKIQQLKNASSIQPIKPPVSIQNILRPYQVEGFQWLCSLNNIGWGGILADDMGLGKTIQTLSFLLHLKETMETIKVLIVSPTTLLYTWENEIKKFTPQLSYHIHHGNQRLTTIEQFTNVDVILTTYGTLRSDIKFFTDISFNYIVLDESQSIKNPISKAAKAVMLLKTNNKLCLSGTPLQNNTFDIYAQMQFLNPSMLGSIEHFKQNFAIPIDKLNDENSKEHLRKLLQPFMLRRTKEQVAKDLPAKTETILYCEMGTEQRDIYETYRQLYRTKILGLVNEQGIQKSQFTILQGLMKLRQICNSTATLNKEEKATAHSVKLDELTRELNENIGNHKVLIFSQFLGMLSLIKDRLTEMEIPFVCFDGSTSAIDREKAIQQFQQDDNYRVFLISLKAGGVGLNLTAADYVYLVDPWWNPAVEQQAIDRTHRIGQNKNVFAYRMICKDTIEDKIIKLQEQKRKLASDLINNDSNFASSLSKEDLEYLFNAF